MFKNKLSNFFVRFDKFWSWTDQSPDHTNLGGRGHRFGMTLESRISRFKS